MNDNNREEEHNAGTDECFKRPVGNFYLQADRAVFPAAVMVAFADNKISGKNNRPAQDN
jgi:hypothetical protein